MAIPHYLEGEQDPLPSVVGVYSMCVLLVGRTLCNLHGFTLLVPTCTVTVGPQLPHTKKERKSFIINVGGLSPSITRVRLELANLYTRFMERSRTLQRYVCV